MNPSCRVSPAACRPRDLIFLALIALTAWAAFPGDVGADLYFSPYIALKFGGETTLIDPNEVAGSSDAADQAKKVTWGGSVMWLGSGALGFEGDVALIPGYFQGDQGLVQSSRVATLVGNVVVAAPLHLTRESLRPYASAGWGLMRATAEIDPNIGLGYSRNLSAFNVGGGVIGMLSRRTGVRWDLRYLRGIGSAEGDTLTGGVHLSYWRASMGLVIRTR